MALVALVALMGSLAAAGEDPDQPIVPDRVIKLFNGENLDGWTTWLVDTKREDPGGVYSVRDGAIRISGDGFGYLSTLQAYKDYRLVVETKWGTQSFRTRIGMARDSGIFLHSVGPDGNSYDCGWGATRRNTGPDISSGAYKAAIECQVMEGGFGDVLLIAGRYANGEHVPLRVAVPAVKRQVPGDYATFQFNPQVEKLVLSGAAIAWAGKDMAWRDVPGFRGRDDVESPLGQWTRLECECAGDRIAVFVNGKLVNEVHGVSPAAGKILLQCEGSEVFYRQVELQPLASVKADTPTPPTPETAAVEQSPKVPKTTNWPQFRGPNAQGLSPHTNLPVTLDPANNVAWKTPIPPGVSSPCVWGDAVFLTAFTDSKRLAVLCVDAGDGRIRWQREVPAQRIENVHPRLGSPAQATPATDGERLYVFFGSVGLVCLDFQGEPLWRHEFLPFSYNLGWGAASSPILYGDSVILNCDHDGESFALALDKRTGQVKWRTPRPDAPASFSTPVLWPVAGQTQLVVAGSGRVSAYDADRGGELWRVEQPGAFVATTPVVSDKLLFVACVDHGNISADFTRSVRTPGMPNFDAMFANHDGDRDGKLNPKEVSRFDQKTFDRIDRDRDGFLTREELQAEFRRQQESGPPQPPAGSDQKRTGNLLAAIRPGGCGDVTESHVAWRVTQAAPYVPSPLLYDRYLFVVRDGGIVACFEAATGKLVWRERVGGSGAYYASPVAGDGKLYLVSEGGEVTVLAAAPEPRVLGRAALGDRCLATPALAQGKVYVRTDSSLCCFGVPNR